MKYVIAKIDIPGLHYHGSDSFTANLHRHTFTIIAKLCIRKENQDEKGQGIFIDPIDVKKCLSQCLTNNYKAKDRMILFDRHDCLKIASVISDSLPSFLMQGLAIFSVTVIEDGELGFEVLGP